MLDEQKRDGRDENLGIRVKARLKCDLACRGRDPDRERSGQLRRHEQRCRSGDGQQHACEQCLVKRAVGYPLDGRRQQIHERHAGVYEVAPWYLSEQHLLRPRKVHVVIVCQVAHEGEAVHECGDAGGDGCYADGAAGVRLHWLSGSVRRQPHSVAGG